MQGEAEEQGTACFLLHVNTPLRSAPVRGPHHHKQHKTGTSRSTPRPAAARATGAWPTASARRCAPRACSRSGRAGRRRASASGRTRASRCSSLRRCATSPGSRPCKLTGTNGKDARRRALGGFFLRREGCGEARIALPWTAGRGRGWVLARLAQRVCRRASSFPSPCTGRPCFSRQTMPESHYRYFASIKA